MSDRAVFDCTVFLQAAARPDLVHEGFQIVEAGMATLCVSAEVITEIREVLNRPRLRQKFPALTAQAVNAFLVHWLERALFIVDVPKVHDLPRDPKDEKYINLAIASDATYLVTRDCDLLDLMDDRRADSRAFRQRFPSLRILLPETFVEEMREGAEDKEKE